MENFKLLNLRELSTEEQVRINGGASSSLCEYDCGTCSCICRCDRLNPSDSIGNEFADRGADAQTGRKQREAMVAA